MAVLRVVGKFIIGKATFEFGSLRSVRDCFKCMSVITAHSSSTKVKVKQLKRSKLRSARGIKRGPPFLLMLQWRNERTRVTTTTTTETSIPEFGSEQNATENPVAYKIDDGLLRWCHSHRARPTSLACVVENVGKKCAAGKKLCFPDDANVALGNECLFALVR